MKRMIPSSKLTVKNDKLTALEGIYDAEGNQIIADGGSLVAGNPEVPAGTSPTELSGLSVQNDSTKVYYKITHSPVVEANPVVPEGTTPTALSGLKVGSDYYGISGGGEEVVAYEGTVGLPASIQISDWTLHRCILNNKILWLVFVGAVTVTDSSENIGNNSVLFSATLPSEVASKIYRKDGTTCNNYSSSFVIIEGATWVASANKSFKICSRSANTISVEGNGPWNLSTGYPYTIDIRIPLFMDIGQ